MRFQFYIPKSLRRLLNSLVHIIYTIQHNNIMYQCIQIEI